MSAIWRPAQTKRNIILVPVGLQGENKLKKSCDHKIGHTQQLGLLGVSPGCRRQPKRNVGARKTRAQCTDTRIASCFSSTVDEIIPHVGLVDTMRLQKAFISQK